MKIPFLAVTFITALGVSSMIYTATSRAVGKYAVGADLSVEARDGEGKIENCYKTGLNMHQCQNVQQEKAKIPYKINKNY